MAYEKFKSSNSASMISICYKLYTGRNCFSGSLSPFPVCDSDKYRSASIYFYSLYLVFLISFFTLFSAVCAAEEPQFYTIQAGSYAGEQGASQLYQDLADSLPESQRLYLRVEKVGGYFTVRAGKFDARQEAVDYRHLAAELLAGSSILQAYIRDERILRVYQPVSETSLALEAEQAAVFAERAVPVSAEQSSDKLGEIAEPENDADHDAGSVSRENISETSLSGAEEFYTIQAGSYAGEQGASQLYQDLADSLPESQHSYLRVEKVGNYFTVRVGKFAARQEAVDYRNMAGDLLAGTSILQAYIKNERILKMMQSPPGEVVLSRDEPGDLRPEEDEKSWEKLNQEIILEKSTPATAPGKMTDTGSVAPVDSASGGTVVTVEVDFPAGESLQETETPNTADSSIAELSGADAADVDGAEDAISYEKPGQPDGILPVRVIKVHSQGIFGHKIMYPSSIGYDRHMDETYLISGGGQHPSSNIIVYGPDYFPVAALGEGRKVFSPRALEFDPEGNMYIIQAKSDGKPSRLSIFNAAFFLQKEIFIDESIPDIPEGFYPNNIALSDGKIYIAGNNNNGVLVLDRQYNFQGWLSPRVSGSQEEVGNDPNDPKAITVIDVAADRNGRVYLLSSDAGRVYVLDKDHKFLFGFGSKGGSTGMLSRPQSLAVDEVRQIIYIVDYMRHAINVYNYKNGRFIFEVGGRGLSPGWFQYPTHIEVDRKSNLIVADYLNHRVQVLYVQ